MMTTPFPEESDSDYGTPAPDALSPVVSLDRGPHDAQDATKAPSPVASSARGLRGAQNAAKAPSPVVSSDTHRGHPVIVIDEYDSGVRASGHLFPIFQPAINGCYVTGTKTIPVFIISGLIVSGRRPAQPAEHLLPDYNHGSTATWNDYSSGPISPATQWPIESS